MDEDTRRYIYSYIEPDEFRVLKIIEVHPQIQFTLETFSIYEAPEYEALSYAWGTSPEMEESVCNGAHFRISRTLGQALRGIHAHSGSGWIWVDAICINQTDAEEKAHQVAGMGELYSCADQVVIWLGDAADQSDLACSLLPELTERIWSLKETEGGWRPLSTDDIVSHGLPHPDDLLWRAALLLYSRAWFQRLWIVQEVVLARACVFLCGARLIEWHVIVNFAIATSRSFFISNIAGLHIKAMGEHQVNRSTNGIRLIRNARRLKTGLEQVEKEIDGLQATMDIMQSQGASVKLDYVYAVRDMLPDALREKVVVDYSDQAQHNYGMIHASFFRQCLERVGDWPSLRFPPNMDRGNIPSWCPPWGSGWNDGYLPVVGCRAGRPAATSLPSSSYAVGETVPLSEVFDRSSSVIYAGRVLTALKDCLAHIPDGPNAHQRLLGVLIGQCGWLKSPQFSQYPDHDVLNSLITFLEHLAENEEHERQAGSGPVNLDTAEYVLDQHRFWRSYLNLIMLRWPGRSFALTTNGRMAIVPCHTKPGDTVCVFIGGTLPQVVTRHDDGKHWIYIGPSVVDGIMEGEMFDIGQNWIKKKEVFCLK
ncbi:heterokaryon incompatibility protein-domain-containing protein [Aspergillus pseudotamarii]|uniref:Heterokaryon incompatibility protein-domain-containing protein n=1 Tax=Aspergillus pseudotamarii TaxID=132259 RepID=A0A5N6T3H1_ASPPS|nr:heterokaryon incompatibility protein-domain-containing protein [Aspergillus pseudotamarii]KAE8140819.1 heterokaryon incompatibility protein-domain-containing protein [Aspergillus pseudotamarii]